MSAGAAIELVVTDLDGTLWGADEVVHVRTLDALRQLSQRELPVLVATGRRLTSAERTLGRAQLRLPMVVLDGAFGHDPHDGRSFHEVPFPSGEAAQVLDAFHGADLSPCVYLAPPGPEVVVGSQPSTHPRHLDLLGPTIARADLRAVVETQPVLMFALVGRPVAQLQQVVRELPEVEAAVTRDVIYGAATLTVRARGVSKWAGVLAYCHEAGLDPGRVLAVGDGHNDLELLSGASVACVVSDGCDEALALADHVISPPHAGGWAHITRLC